MSKFVKVLKGLFKDEAPEISACSCSAQPAPAPAEAAPGGAAPAPEQQADDIPAIQQKSGCC